MKLHLGAQCATLPAGERVLDGADDHPHLGLTVSCRSAHCGACLVRVVSDPVGVDPAGEAERETLLTLGRPDCRLGCQLVLSGATEDVELEPA